MGHILFIGDIKEEKNKKKYTIFLDEAKTEEVEFHQGSLKNFYI